MESSGFDPLTEDTAAQVGFRQAQGGEVRATVLRLMPQAVVLEIYDPSLVLRASEVLSDFKIGLRNRTIYSGHAVVRTLFNGGPPIVAEVALDKDSWRDLQFVSGVLGAEKLGDDFKEFVQGWQKFYLVGNDYKVVIADLQTFLTDLRLWLEQVELGLPSASEAQRSEVENQIANRLRSQVTAALSNMFERFEEVSDKIEDDLQPAHRAFGQRQLHPHLLCAPFIHRTYTKPLGYAGDYEMMNMIARNGFEGNSLYAKLTNAYLLDQVGPQAVRNRVKFLRGIIQDETSRIARLGRTASIYSIACGPAKEVEDFIVESPLAERAQFRLLDFNEETLLYTGNRMDEIRREYHRRTSVKLIKNSVQNLLRGNNKPAAEAATYDLIYCSGLYDYLNDRVIRALNTHFYERLQPGGLLVVGNFAPNTPVKNFIEHFLEWFLIYRDGRQLAALAPEQVSPADCRVIAEPTGTNIFLEVRKPQ
ncbi:MAG TPA: class I SAM-dependent methyltransferase family protein [Candidatus Nitrosotalea sp.]|nr:class I SAM-dependent methyltransferase family protein [Candidatus Nitrosotalea sp.]